MKTFGTRGPVDPAKNYVVQRRDEIADFINRVKEGHYIVIFAPRQTGKTTFFHWALDTLADDEPTYLPIQLDFQVYSDLTPSDFYACLYEDIREEIENIFQRRESMPSEALTQFWDTTKITDSVSMLRFFRQLAKVLKNQRFVILIDEFDGIPQAAMSNFLYSLRRIYISRTGSRCPHSLGIVGVKRIAQLNYDRSISPFNIQDEFALPNFTLEQVRELLTQYADEVGQAFAPEVITSIHKQTVGQPFLVNRFAQILTEEMAIPKTEAITMAHFSKAHASLLREPNVNIAHLITNIRRDRHFERILMKITLDDEGVDFNLRNELISELATYGVIAEGPDSMCEIVNPIYQYCIMQAFKPPVNGLERNYFPKDTGDGFRDYLTATGQIDMQLLLDNFRDFITRVGFRILQVPDTPQEYVGQHLLFAYLDQFVRIVRGTMHLEVPTGRGRMALIISHNMQKYIVETKIWRGDSRYQTGKKQLAAYLKLEGATEGYYVVFDHRMNSAPRVKSETVDGLAIRSYVIPVVQERPSVAP